MDNQMKTLKTAIKNQEKKLGVKINLYPIDGNHLDSIWYGDEVGRVLYPNGGIVLIEAHGDILCDGNIDKEPLNGQEPYKAQGNCGEFYKDFGNTLDDEKLNKLQDNPTHENWLEFQDYNWFEYNLILPNGVRVYLADLEYDNVAGGTLIDCIENIDPLGELFDMIDEEGEWNEYFDEEY